MAIPDFLGSKCLDISLQTTSCIGMSKAYTKKLVHHIIQLALKTFQLAQVRHLTAATATTAAVRACPFVHA